MPSIEEAFTHYYSRHYDDVKHFVARRIDHHEVDDVVAEVFIVVWRRFQEANRQADPMPWLYRVARNVILNKNRGTIRRTRLQERVAERDHPGQDAEDFAQSVADLTVLSRAFLALSQSDQEVLRLIAWEGLSLKQGAAVVGTSYAAFAMRASRAKRRLERLLQNSCRNHATADQNLDDWKG